MQTVDEIPILRPVRVAPARVLLRAWPYILTLLVATGIGIWAFLYGDQPVVLDAAGYYEFARMILRGGLGAFASDTRTYAYPAFLAALMLIVGPDLPDLQPAVFVVQLGLLFGAAWIGARRLGSALGIDGIGRAIFVVTAANPFLLVDSVQVLTELTSAVLIYLAVTLSLPQRRAGSAWRVTLLAAAALCCAGLASMIRPASLIVAPAVVGIWIARARLFRDVPWRVLPLALLAFVLPFVPQTASNLRSFGVPHPLIVGSMYAGMMGVGFENAKTGSLVIAGVPSMLAYANPFRPPPEPTIGQTILKHPLLYAGTVALHTFAVLDQDYPFTFIRNVDPWYRWPLWTLSTLFFLGAGVGLVVGLRESADAPSLEARRRRRFTLLALAVATVALFAVYVPTEVQNRYVAPLYLLLAAPFVLAVFWVWAAFRAGSVSRLALGGLAVALVLGSAALLSVWLQTQAPLLVELRAGTIGPKALARRDARPPAPPTPVPGPTAPPAREIPVAQYVADIPKELTANRSSDLDVTVTNAGQETWNIQGVYPANVAFRFIALNTELYERVKVLMRDGESVPLPSDVQPGESVTLHLRIVAPPEPGRYRLMIHVTRAGLPDTDAPLERVVRVVN